MVESDVKRRKLQQSSFRKVRSQETKPEGVSIFPLTHEERKQISKHIWAKIVTALFVQW